VFKLAVGVLEDVARSVLVKADRQDSDIDWLIPHQANIRIMQSTAKKLKLPLGQAGRHRRPARQTLGRRRSRWRSTPRCATARSRPGDTVMLEGVGGGFTWGAVLLDF
jgi:3-oxoacyl-[acyl-carrier-protein] synthase-3